MRMFETIKIKNTILKNRIIFPPTYTCMGVDTGEALEYYTARAKGGASVVIVEGTDIDMFKKEGFFDKISILAKSITGAGAAAVLQIRSHYFSARDEVWVSEKMGTREISTEEIQESVESFGYAAQMAEKAGFDGIDVHGAHSFLLNMFFSPIENKRNDKYGGSLENRMRYGLEIVASIRENVSDNFLIFYRHTPVEVNGGYTIEDSLKFAKELEKAGIDVMDISPGKGPSGEIAEYAAPFKRVLDIPVMTVNGFNIPGNIENVLQSGKCDLVGIGRGLIADPELPLKLQSGSEESIISCIECDKLCYGNIAQGKAVSCVKHKQL